MSNVLFVSTTTIRNPRSGPQVPRTGRPINAEGRVVASHWIAVHVDQHVMRVDHNDRLRDAGWASQRAHDWLVLLIREFAFLSASFLPIYSVMDWCARTGADGPCLHSRWERKNTMLRTVALVMLVLWILGLMSSQAMGGFIHVLLVVAIVVVLVDVIGGRKGR